MGALFLKIELNDHQSNQMVYISKKLQGTLPITDSNEGLRYCRGEFSKHTVIRMCTRSVVPMYSSYPNATKTNRNTV